ncbi:MAG: plasmid recombination protein [Methylotenera sp.]|nr:plasmid recombination protein [Methylotenera sp.]MDO9389323.1 plasmid recombination protein [Methylotenera sp.]
MAASHLLRLGSVRDIYNKQGKLIQNGLLALLKHHKRTEAPKDNIDASKSALNYCLTSPATPVSIANYASGQMLKAGIEAPRKNGVMAVEVLFSLPNDRHAQNTKPFFNDCFEWVKLNFEGELLSFDIHLDEAAPHAHALILPLIDGKMQGNKLIGGTGNLMRLINLFHAKVAKHYGFSRSDYKRYNSADKASIALAVLNHLQGDSIMKSSAWPWAREAIFSDPFPLAQTFEIVIDKPTIKTNKSFVDIKRSHGKGSFET